MSPSGIYFSSWAAKWFSNASDMELAKIDANIVYLAFCLPSCDYNHNQRTFTGTGLSFSQDFDVVVGAIDILRAKGTKVMLSVGGGRYSDWSNVNYEAIDHLRKDLHCDGVDIDWEPSGGGGAEKWGDIIGHFYGSCGGFLSAAVFSTGAYGPQAGNHYKGINIPGLVESGSKLDWLNIMAYDAGKEYDALGAYDCYRIYYKGPLYVGFELGKQGWGDAIISLDHVDNVCNYLKYEEDGVFVWAWGSTVDIGPTYDQVTARIKTHQKPYDATIPIYVTPADNTPIVSAISAFNCPNCNWVLKVAK